MINDDMHTIEVRGLLSYLFPLNFAISEDVAKTVIGKPIKNCNHIVIGKIDDISWSTGEWIGRIVVDNSLSEAMLEGYRSSMEVRKE